LVVDARRKTVKARNLKFGLAVSLLGALTAQAQIVPGPRWYRSATGMLGMPPANVGLREIERMERYMVFGVSGCGGLNAQALAANRALATQMSGYLSGVNRNATDPQARAAALRLATAWSSFPCAYPGQTMPLMAPPPPPQPGDPPFSLRSPDLGQVPDDQQEMAADLVVRYDTDAARSATTWKNAEVIRLNLAGRGMAMNAQTATAVSRLQPLYEEAAAELKAHKWDEALSTLQAAEATTQKIAAVVGK
jgi:hypothetical protein